MDLNRQRAIRLLPFKLPDWFCFDIDIDDSLQSWSYAFNERRSTLTFINSINKSLGKEGLDEMAPDLIAEVKSSNCKSYKIENYQGVVKLYNGYEISVDPEDLKQKTVKDLSIQSACGIQWELFKNRTLKKWRDQIGHFAFDPDKIESQDERNELEELLSKNCNQLLSMESYLSILDENKVFLELNLLASNEQLIEDFSRWLDEFRQTVKPTYIDSNLAEKHVKRWKKIKILPYIDLVLLAKIEGIKIKQDLMGDLLLPLNEANTTEIIRKTVQPEYKLVMSKEFLSALSAQVNA